MTEIPGILIESILAPNTLKREYMCHIMLYLNIS